MSNYAEVVILVEGQTEQQFVKQLLAPYLAVQNVFLTPIILSKPGQKGGDVKFARAKNDIAMHLKQRQQTWITLLVDYYGIHADWPGYTQAQQANTHYDKAHIMRQATATKVQENYPNYHAVDRFIPYVSMHELEALYFSDPIILANKLDILPAQIEAILAEFGEPENINNHVNTAPSKRLKQLCPRFKKTSTGMAIAEKIGIAKMREACPLFHAWVNTLENLAGTGF